MVKEQRRSPRYELQLPVQVIRIGATRVDQRGETNNLSATGVLLSTDLPLHVGDVVEYHISLPTPPGQRATPPMRCLGKVVRIQRDTENGVPQAALTLERYEFLR